MAAQLTRNSELIYALLKDAPKAMSAYEILDALKEYSIKSPPIVYRGLKALEEKGLIHRIESMNAYKACCDYHEPHIGAALLTCVKCGAIEEVHSKALEAFLSSMPLENHFIPSPTNPIEVKGQCEKCRD